MAGRSISELVVQAHSSRLYTVSMESRFGNWTDAEISQHFKPAVAPEAKSTSFAAPSTRRGASTDDGDLTVDWTAFAGVVHDQRECGACWAFSAADSVAASIAISDGGRVEELAAQELVDCDDGSARGCAGGNPREALDYVQAFGVGLAADYPYEARQTVCRKNATRPAAAVHRVEYIRSEAAMLQALKRGPVAIGVAASQRSFLLYRSGVYDDEASADLPLDHALLVVGAGRTLDGTPYWKMKSSWSTAWGENGYATNRVRILRGRGLCGLARGLATTAAAPVGAARRGHFVAAQAGPTPHTGLVVEVAALLFFLVATLGFAHYRWRPKADIAATRCPPL